MRVAIGCCLVLACSKGTAPPPPSQEPAPAPVRLAEATSFKVGDKVILYPVDVMTISAIGTRKELTPKDMENVDFQPGNALAGKDTMVPVEADNERVYALRFVGEDRDSFLLSVAQAEHEG